MAFSTVNKTFIFIENASKEVCTARDTPIYFSWISTNTGCVIAYDRLSERAWEGTSKREEHSASDEFTKFALVGVTKAVGTWTEQAAILGEVIYNISIWTEWEGMPASLPEMVSSENMET